MIYQIYYGNERIINEGQFPSKNQAVDAIVRRCRQFKSQYTDYFVLGVAGTLSKPIVYLAHPVGKTPLANAFNAAKWLRWFITNDPSRIYVAHWIGEVLAFPEETGEAHRDYEASLSDDVEVLCKFDEIVLVGGKISNGMQQELDRAKQEHKRITDMSRFTLPSDLPEGFFLDPA